jgi:hypothetical protein
MLGGLFTSFLMELLIYPVIFYVAKSLSLGVKTAPPSPGRLSAPVAGSPVGGNGEEPHA